MGCEPGLWRDVDVSVGDRDVASSSDRRKANAISCEKLSCPAVRDNYGSCSADGRDTDSGSATNLVNAIEHNGVPGSVRVNVMPVVCAIVVYVVVPVVGGS